MAWMDPRAVERRRKRFTRQDAWRLAPPGTPEAKMPGYLHPSARIAAFERAQQEAAWQQRAAWEARQRELLAIRRELDELKSELAAKRAAEERADEAARIKRDIAWERFLQTHKRYAAQQQSGLDRKWDGQPHDDLGRFDFGKKPKPDSEPALARLPGLPPLRVPVVAPPPVGVENALRECAAASRWTAQRDARSLNSTRGRSSRVLRPKTRQYISACSQGMTSVRSVHAIGRFRASRTRLPICTLRVLMRPSKNEARPFICGSGMRLMGVPPFLPLRLWTRTSGQSDPLSNPRKPDMVTKNPSELTYTKILVTAQFASMT